MMAIRSGIDLTQGEAYITSEMEYLSLCLLKIEKLILLILEVLKKWNYSYYCSWPKTGDVGVQINIAGYYDTEGKLKREPITLLVGSGAIDSSIIQSWNQDTSWRAAGKVEITIMLIDLFSY